MSSQMSELAGLTEWAEAAAEQEALKAPVLRERTAALGSRKLPTNQAEKRQQQLWTTLTELGIRPKSVTSEASHHSLM